MRKELKMERRVESTTWRKKTLEGRRNRPGGDKGGGGSGLKQRRGVRVLEPPAAAYI
jgi:hypothetical protein